MGHQVKDIDPGEKKVITVKVVLLSFVEVIRRQNICM